MHVALDKTGHDPFSIQLVDLRILRLKLHAELLDLPLSDPHVPDVDPLDRIATEEEAVSKQAVHGDSPPRLTAVAVDRPHSGR